VDPVADSVARALGLDASRTRASAAGGGCIADSFILDDGSQRVFVKAMPAQASDTLDAECDGLSRLADAGEIRVPDVLAAGTAAGSAWLALEWLALGRADRDAQAQLGRRLARLHGHRAGRFGLDVDNFIGATPQRNTPTDDWTEFFFDRRIGDQVERLAAGQTGFGADVTAALRDAWTRAYGDYRPEPSLLHGDLWAGNAGALPDGTPVVFDPAVHYGDRECDLAMAALFGGFGTAFFDAYAHDRPLQPGWRQRREYYQLYHVLNHANLFGGGYVDDARRRIERLVSI
jgi:fructosamine-3-kinase